MAERRSRINLRSINMNLLPILEALLANRSVTEAASRLHMSQSAVSDALARLRVQFRDELLIRQGRQMQLTPLARELLGPVSEILARVESLVETPAFDPGLLDREFVVATADPVIMTIGGPLCQYLQQHAPAASVSFVDLGRRAYDRLRGMELDLMIVPRGFVRSQHLIESAIYKEIFVCIARRNHPQIDGGISKALYASLPHISYRTDQDATSGMEAQLIGLDQHDVIKVPSFSLLPLIVEQTDAIALVQQRVAERFAQTASIEIFEPPVPIPPLDVCMYWSSGHQQDAAHRWLRESLSEVARSLDCAD